MNYEKELNHIIELNELSKENSRQIRKLKREQTKFEESYDTTIRVIVRKELEEVRKYLLESDDYIKKNVTIRNGVLRYTFKRKDRYIGSRVSSDINESVNKPSFLKYIGGSGYNSEAEFDVLKFSVSKKYLKSQYKIDSFRY